MMSEKNCYNCHNLAATIGEERYPLCSLVDCHHEDKWIPDYKILKSQLSAITAERDRMREALGIGIKWMEFWLGENLCECEYGHTCGKDERKRELKQMKDALSSSPEPSEGEIYRKALTLLAAIYDTMDNCDDCPNNKECSDRSIGHCKNRITDYCLSEAKRQLRKENENG